MALAYRAAMGDGLGDGSAQQRAVAAYLRFGGTADDARRDVPRMIATVAAQHGAWFWRPTRARLAREKAALEAMGWWPGPVEPAARRDLVARAIALLEARDRPAPPC